MNHTAPTYPWMFLHTAASSVVNGCGGEQNEVRRLFGAVQLGTRRDGRAS